ncbi:hypothetical protein KZX06_09685 [Micrococcus sp. EYE_162]|uniref:hypothetical protein n=1 Tax=Micrococcus TaxID=1269 RepID=UPI00200486FE|nr:MULTISPECIES: hypothetical protein [unclassified Micrococcus]MCK6096197.1 hypothetical protein [Micrococcus sp. EYE_212]MCK6172288.1 hypothetical protein [Micrococcus sp. EYE_162]
MPLPPSSLTERSGSRRHRVWGATAALALLLSGCSAPQSDGASPGGPAAQGGDASASATTGTGPSADSSAASSSEAETEGPLAARSNPDVPMRAYGADERPPQFVLFSFDGGNQDARWKSFMETADEAGAKFTVFQSGINLVGSANKEIYSAPGNEPGVVQTEFGGPEAEVAQRVENINEAHARGHEIGTHYSGHLCASAEYGANKWSTAEWEQEIGTFYEFLDDPRRVNGYGEDFPELEVEAEDVKGGRLPCLDGEWDALVPVWKEHGLEYDTSHWERKPGVAWPYQKDGIWEFDMPTVYSPVLAEEGKKYPMVLAMDYNFWMDGNGGKEVPADKERLGRFQRETYLYVYESAFNGNRAPLVFGNHFNTWNDNTFNPAVDQVMREVCQKEDTYCVTYQQMVDWLELQDPAVLKQWQEQARSADGTDAAGRGR